MAANITVNSTLDSDSRDGELTLREAILVSNRTLSASTLTATEQTFVSGVPTDSDTDTIAFNIPGSGVQTISPATALPIITDPVIIDGYTQPGAVPNTNSLTLGPGALGINAKPLIELRGTNAGNGASGLTISAGASAVRGLAINSFGGATGGSEILLMTNGNNIVEGNILGTDPTGTLERGGHTGVTIVSGEGNRIGTNADGINDSGERNLIAERFVNIDVGMNVAATIIQGNFFGTDVSGTTSLYAVTAPLDVRIREGANGTRLGGTAVGSGNLLSGRSLGVTVNDATGTVIQGNLFDTDLTGSAALSIDRGVQLTNAPSTIIGGTAASAKNVFAGGQPAIAVEGDSGGTVIQGNFIGTDITGIRSLATIGSTGIHVLSTDGILIGGTAPGAGNLVSGGGVGIQIGGNDHVVQGNRIGTQADGVSPLGNFHEGIVINGGRGTNIAIGGTAPGAGNTIAFNNEEGIAIRLQSQLYVNNPILGNSIFRNGGLGIDIPLDGVNANDFDDADIGPNNRQNSPFLSLATLSGAALTLKYFVSSTTANSTYPLRVEFFKADVDGQEGQTFLGFDTYTAVEAGTKKSVTFATAPMVAPGDKIVATATDALGNTSEFSANVIIQSANCNTAVVNTNDSGAGSLREAITCANIRPGTDTISFNIPGSGVHTISPATNLPTINDPVIVDGYTQPGATPNSDANGFNGTLLIELHAPTGNSYGLALATNDSTIRGLIVNGAGLAGIQILSTGAPVPEASGNVIQGNFLGTNATGTAAIPNRHGVAIEATSTGASRSVNNRIGGPNPADRNVISGNQLGVHLLGLINTVQNNVIQGNFIGTNASGTSALPNEIGIRIFGGTSGTIIGGSAAGEGNLISGNLVDGIGLGGSQTICSNTFTGGESTGNAVRGNKIGTDITGMNALGNGKNGITVGFSSLSTNVIGGVAAGDANTIAFNGLHGVGVLNSHTAILSNSIFSNSQLGIHFGPGCASTPNDTDDADVGPSNLQNHPVISSASVSNGSLSVSYAVPSSTVNSSYPLRVEFFKADSAGQEGRTFLGDDTYVSAEAGAAKTATFLASVGAGDKIVATATDNGGNTSEFSPSSNVGCSIVVTNTNDSGPGSLRQAIICANGTPNIDRLGDPEFVDPDPITFNIPVSGVQTINLASPLPTIVDPVYIDGYTQPGSSQSNLVRPFNGTLLIELNGANAGPANGLTITGGGSTVRGLIINRFSSFEGDPQVRGNGIFLVEKGGNGIEGNFLGTNAAGTAALPNFNSGVRIRAGQGDPSSNVIGGVGQQTRNIISGNGGDGIVIGGAASQTFVAGNSIGTQKDGSSPLGNGQSGIRFIDTAFNNLVGGDQSGAANTIAFNGADGVTVASAASILNEIVTNTIFSNGGSGIDLGDDGATPNDIDDADTGANNLQNFPIITDISPQIGGGTVVTGRINSWPNIPYLIEIYSSAASDLANFGEGQLSFGSTVVVTDAEGNATFSVASQAPSPAGRLFTATATFEETSEFAPSICSLIVTNTLDSGLGSLREAITCANAAPNIDRNGDAIVDPDPIKFAVPADDPRHFYYRNDGLNGGLKNLTVTTATDDTTIGNIDPDWRHSWYSIQIDTPMPMINEAVLIDGFGQLGASPNTAGLTEEVNAVLRIEVIQNATSAGSEMNAFVLGAGSSTIRGLVINRFDAHGIQVHSDGNTIAGCYIGSDVSATQELGNGGDGIRINGRSGNLIGGTSAADRNYIRDNGASGVALVNGATHNVVQGSFIVRNTATPSGSDQTKTAGVLIDESPDNLIGGILNGSGNGISGNDRGILIVGSGASGNIVQGNSVHGNQPGVYIRNAHDNIVGGTTPDARNFIFRNGDGVRIESNDPTAAAYNNVVLGNYIGLDRTGMATGFATLSIGVWILGPEFGGGAYHNTVGGLEEGAGNVLSGDNDQGVRISGSLATENVVQGNLIGLAPDGKTPLGNFGFGVLVFEGAHDNTIGGQDPASRNVISANRFGGLAITGAGVTGNLIQGNHIGTDASGTLDRGNLGDGIMMQDDATANILRDNVVSGNNGTGIRIYRPGTSGNSILGNKIGTAADGISPLGNTLNGVEIQGPSNTQIGGTELGNGNVIAFNGGIGVSVRIFGISAGTGNAILGNSIFANGLLGIDLSQDDVGPDGVTLNDVGDQDTGPNNLQNFADIAEAIAATNVMRVSYLVTSTPGNSTYPARVEFFKADANGQGQIFLGSDVYSAADFETGEKLVTFATAIVVAPGDKIVATATDSSPSGGFANTSEFSPPRVTKASPWHNLAKPLDVDGDFQIVASDALDIINFLNAFGAMPVPPGAADGPLFYDSDNDLSVTAADALDVINYLNAFGADFEGEPRQSQAASDLSISGNTVPLDHLFDLLALDLTHNARKNPRR